jgi:ABC-type uncharacterized transport system substrate-binding protein
LACFKAATYLALRWTGGRAETTQRLAVKAVAAKPDAIFVTGGSAIQAVQRQTRSIPIVFQLNVDPVTAGMVASRASSGWNDTEGRTEWRCNFDP